MSVRRLAVVMIAAALGVGAWAAPAAACGGLVGPNGAVRLVRTSTLAAYHDGVEHYVTSFQFAGSETEVGSIVPLPDLPTKVERGGDWTLQRLQLEVAPAPTAEGVALSAAEDGGVTVHLETRIDALDITVLEGGGAAVAAWAEEHGYALSADAPEVLEFYARRSPYFMAARFDATAAAERGQLAGDGTPVHLTIPTDDPWVPLRILALGKPAEEVVEADVFLLTEGRPALLAGPGLRHERSEAASPALLADLRSDAGMEWVPDEMWLTYLAVDVAAGDLVYDLAIHTGPTGAPSVVDTGLVSLDELIEVFESEAASPWAAILAASAAVALAVTAALAQPARRRLAPVTRPAPEGR